MRQHHTEIESAGAAVLAVSFETSDRLLQLSRQLRLPFPLLSDPERDAYRAYGLNRGRLSQLLSYGTVCAYIRLLAQGRRYHFRRSDMRQLGGDFLIDGAGKIQYQHRSAAPHDRPSVVDLLEILEA